MTHHRWLAVLLLGACTAPTQVVALNADEGSTAPAAVTAPVVPVTTPYEGSVVIDYDSSGPGVEGQSGAGWLIAFWATVAANPACPNGTMYGNCCMQTWDTINDPYHGDYQGAGRITVADAATTTAPTAFVFDPYDPDGYEMWSEGGAADDAVPGDTLLVAATGDAIHAFSASAVIPSAPVGFPEEFKNSNWGTIALSREHNWTSHWTPDGASYVNIELQGSLGMLDCRGNDADGELEISAALLSAVTVDGDSGAVFVDRHTIAPLQSDNTTGDLDVFVSLGAADVQF